MIIRKKDNKDEEIQDGWIGRVLPFKLVQEKFLKSNLEDLQNKEERLLIVESEYIDITESLSEDERTLINSDENTDQIDIKKVKGFIKESDENINDKETFTSKLTKYVNLIEEEKVLKSNIKKSIVELYNLTKSTIEALTDEQAIFILNQKWVHSLIESIMKLPDEFERNLITKVNYFDNKYKTTFSEISNEIEEVQKSLVELMDELISDEYNMLGLNELKSLLKGIK